MGETVVCSDCSVTTCYGFFSEPFFLGDTFIGFHAFTFTHVVHYASPAQEQYFAAQFVRGLPPPIAHTHGLLVTANSIFQRLKQQDISIGIPHPILGISSLP